MLISYNLILQELIFSVVLKSAIKAHKVCILNMPVAQEY